MHNRNGDNLWNYCDNNYYCIHAFRSLFKQSQNGRLIMKKWELIRIIVASVILTTSIGIIVVWNHNQFQHTNCMEAYYLRIEYSEGRDNENISYSEMSMVEEAFFFILFELDVEYRYVIKYGHVQDGFVYDTQIIIVNHSTSELIQPFYFRNEAMIGLYETDRWCGDLLIGMIYVRRY